MDIWTYRQLSIIDKNDRQPATNTYMYTQYIFPMYTITNQQKEKNLYISKLDPEKVTLKWQGVVIANDFQSGLRYKLL